MIENPGVALDDTPMRGVPEQEAKVARHDGLSFKIAMIRVIPR
jgi:hypothetical protein